MDDNFQSDRRMRKEKLMEYYKTQPFVKVEPIYDLDSTEFDYNAYIKKILKEEGLSTLMDKEKEMLDQIRNLDSEMQTLVYDNYNKFIYATDTIKNMKSDFRFVEEEMNLLGEKICQISKISKELQQNLNPRREELKKLAGTHQLLKRLEYLFELPDRLRRNIAHRQYLAAVRSHSKAQIVLDRYQDLPSFEGIRNDCNSIIEELRVSLWTKFEDINVEAQELSSVVMILAHIREPRSLLATKYLSHCSMVINRSFQSLKEQAQTENDGNNPFIPDILHFANITTELVLDKLSTQISVYTELFLQEFENDDYAIKGHLTSSKDSASVTELNELLLKYVDELIPMFLDIVIYRLDKEKEVGDTTMLARAMDRIHSRLQALNKLIPLTTGSNKYSQVNLAKVGLNLVCKIAHDRCLFYSELLSRQLNDCVTDIRQRLAASQVGSGGALASLVPTIDQLQQTKPESKPKSNGILCMLLQSLSDTLVDQLKATLNAQQAFIATDNTFSKKTEFQVTFCLQDIRQTLFVGFIETIISYCNDVAQQSTGGSSFCPLFLILARFCQNWADQGTLDYLLTIVDEQFLITTIKSQDTTVQLTSVESLSVELRQCSVNLTNAYVRIQGNCLSQMIRKSVDTRDWLNCVEPRSVRSIMKRVVEDMAQIDIQVSQLLPSKQKTCGDQSSDSSRRQIGGPSWAFNTSNNIHADRFLSNINKLFAEKIHIFARVIAVRESVLTGIVRIVLKTFMECVRLKTFGRYGLQQIQVDCRYLQIHLWRFVSDENIMQTILDDVISSVVHRCADPVFMEESIVDAISEN